MTIEREPEVDGFKVSNLAETRFECTFGRGCDGVCCRNGLPPVSEDEGLRIAYVLPRILAALRPKAQSKIRRQGFLSGGTNGWPRVRVADGWCVFFNAGCELHRLGLGEGDAHRYKPASCAIFPLAQDGRGVWYVRQHGARDETFGAPCLSPGESAPPAALTLAAEVALAERLDREGRYTERLAEAVRP